MNIRYQMFIIVAIIYHNCAILSGKPNIIKKGSDNCDCDVLQITMPDGSSNFTKQTGLINRKQYYFSMKRNLISWNKQKWSYGVYVSKSKKSMPIQEVNNNFFSFEKMCNNVTKGINWNGKDINITSQCLRPKSISKRSVVEIY